MGMKPGSSGRDDRSGQQIVELDPSNSNDDGPMREIVVQFSGQLFNAFTLAERVRLFYHIIFASSKITSSHYERFTVCIPSIESIAGSELLRHREIGAQRSV